LVGWLVGWLIGWLVGWLIGWLVGLLAVWLVGCLFVCLFVWLVGWLVNQSFLEAEIQLCYFTSQYDNNYTIKHNYGYNKIAYSCFYTIATYFDQS